jgi:hypothetical protein
MTPSLPAAIAAPDATHVIDEVEVDLAFSSARDVGALEPELGRVAMSRWLPAIERVFDEVSPGADVLTVDRLELDLGVVAFDEIDERLADALRRALRGLVETVVETHAAVTADQAVAAQTAIANAAVMPAAALDLEQLAFFLDRGYMPWTAARLASAAAAGAFDALVRRVVRDRGAVLHQLLHDDRHGHRLARARAQFPADAWTALLAHANPPEAATPDAREHEREKLLSLSSDTGPALDRSRSSWTACGPRPHGCSRVCTAKSGSPTAWRPGGGRAMSRHCDE